MRSRRGIVPTEPRWYLVLTRLGITVHASELTALAVIRCPQVYMSSRLENSHKTTRLRSGQPRSDRCA